MIPTLPLAFTAPATATVAFAGLEPAFWLMVALVATAAAWIGRDAIEGARQAALAMATARTRPTHLRPVPRSPKRLCDA
jgi:ribosomal protein L16/L10AE